MQHAPNLTAVVVAYNGGVDLAACVASLLRQSLSAIEVIVVDNNSTDGSTASLDAQFGDRLQIIRLPDNRGYAAGANAGLRAARGDLVAVLNQDLVLHPGCLEEMRRVLLASDREALVTPKLVLKSDPRIVNAIGNDVHLSGVAWCNGLGTPVAEWRGVTDVPAISGAAFMARRSFLHLMGGLEERYFMYMEDVDFSLRARAVGATCLAACDAVAEHAWSLVLNPAKFELLERNRRALWHRFWGRTPRMYPVLMQAELMSWLYAVAHGKEHLRAKMRARDWPRLPLERPDELRSVLARIHPYWLMFPNRPVLGWIGRMADRLFAASVEQSVPRE